MFSNVGTSGLVIIAIVALVIFGPKKLPEMGKAFGQTLREFKKSANDLTADTIDEKKSVKEDMK